MAKKALFPTILAALFAVTPFLLQHNANRSQFDEQLKALSQSQQLLPHYAKINRSIAFHKQARNVETNQESAQQVADMYFRLGEVLLQRGTPEALDLALDAYKNAVRHYPPLRHGWGYYQMASVYQRLGRYRQAAEHFQKVSQFDFGELALRAGYQLCRVRHQLEQAINPVLLYEYLRYSANGDYERLNVFQNAQFHKQPVSPYARLYIQAVLAYLNQQDERAVNLIGKYRENMPRDYSAHYFFDLIQKTKGAPLYPSHGNLMIDPHAPLALRNGVVRLLEKGELRADFYWLPETGSADPTLQLKGRPPSQMQGEVRVKVNETEYTRPFAESAVNFEISFPPQPGKNVVSVSFVYHGQDKPPLSTWFEIHALQINSASSRSAL